MGRSTVHLLLLIVFLAVSGCAGISPGKAINKFPSPYSVNFKNCTGNIDECVLVIIPENIDARFSSITSNDRTEAQSEAKEWDTILGPVNSMESILLLGELNKRSLKDPIREGPNLIYISKDTNAIWLRYLDEKNKKIRFSNWKKFILTPGSGKTFQLSYELKENGIHFALNELSKNEAALFHADQKEIQKKIQDTDILPTEHSTELKKITHMGRANHSSITSFGINDETNRLFAVVATKALAVEYFGLRYDEVHHGVTVVEFSHDNSISTILSPGAEYNKNRERLYVSWIKDGTAFIILNTSVDTVSIMKQGEKIKQEKIIFDASQDLTFIDPKKEKSISPLRMPFLDQRSNMLYLDIRLDYKDNWDNIIVRKNLKTGEVRKIADGGSPAISPDNQSIAFSKNIWEKNEHGIYISKFMGDELGEPELLVDLAAHFITWSPDGNYIAFLDLKSKNIFAIRITDRAKFQLTKYKSRDSAFDCGGLIWGKNGYIYFTNSMFFLDEGWVEHTSLAGSAKDVWQLKPVLQ